jgi:hypothetical protein
LGKADQPRRSHRCQAHLDGNGQRQHGDNREQQVPQRMSEVQPAGKPVIIGDRFAQHRHALAQLAGDDTGQQHRYNNGADLCIELGRDGPLDERIQQALRMSLELIWR